MTDGVRSMPISIMCLSAIFAIAGVMHFVAPGPFIRIVPGWVTYPRAAVYVSGVAEILGALGFLLPQTRVAASWGLIALLFAVFPANIQMLQLARHANSAAWYVAALWIRLPFQPLLIWWLYKSGIKSG